MNTTATKKSAKSKKKFVVSAPRAETSLFGKKKKPAPAPAPEAVKEVVPAPAVAQETASVKEISEALANEAIPPMSEIMTEAIALPVAKGRRGRPGVHDKLMAYKDSIEILRDKEFTAKDITNFLNENGFNLSYTVVKNFIDTEWPEAIKKRVKA